MIAINIINNKFMVQFDEFTIELNREEFSELRKLCYSASTDRVVCRACGTGNLNWEQVDGKWLLFYEGQLHDCPVKPLSEFDQNKCDWL